MNRTMMKAVLAVVLLTTGLQVSGEEVLEAIVAVVNQDVITLSDFKQQDEMLYQSLSSRYQGEELENIYRKSRKSLLDSMITDILLLQEAEKQNIDVSGQIEKMLEDMKEQYGFSSIEEIRSAMGEQGINYESWLDFQERELLKEGVIFYSFGK
ncbi:MAG: SurA N-terminal domain-containing protein, partial [Acidobacteriota bacterium]